MADTKIEILGGDDERLSVAFYHDIPLAQRQAAAVDNARQPAGTRLTAQDVSDLRAGIIHETVLQVAVNGLTPSQARARLEALHAEYLTKARSDYRARYQFVGMAWNGSAWN